jgi:RNA polymerase sigma-70 factor (family 1)
MPYNENELLLQLQSGSEYAFTRIYERYQGKIFGVALKFLQSPVLAEEIVQDVFLKIWLKRAELNTIANFDGFLFIIARNLIFDQIKKMGYDAAVQKELLTQPLYVDDAEYTIRHHQCQQLLKNAIDLLPKQQKLVYQFAKVEGLSQKMIAQRMGLSRLTVKAHMSRALQYIRKYLNSNFCIFLVCLFIATQAEF